MRTRIRFLGLVVLLALTLTAVWSEASERTESIKLALSEGITASSDVAGLDEIVNGILSADGLTYQEGSKGIGVREFQNLLISCGYSAFTRADGIYGTKTASAVRDFQAANNLPVTGKADLLTQISLVMNKGSFMRKGNTYIARVKNYAVIIWSGKAFYIGAVDKSANLAEGTYYYSDGNYYAGEYRANLRFGKGTAHFANGDVYVGQWKNDSMHGYGTYYYGGLSSAEYYRGNMANNAMHGEGTYYLGTRKITGTWSNNLHVN